LNNQKRPARAKLYLPLCSEAMLLITFLIMGYQILRKFFPAKFDGLPKKEEP